MEYKSYFLVSLLLCTVQIVFGSQDEPEVFVFEPGMNEESIVNNNEKDIEELFKNFDKNNYRKITHFDSFSKKINLEGFSENKYYFKRLFKSNFFSDNGYLLEFINNIINYRLNLDYRLTKNQFFNHREKYCKSSLTQTRQERLRCIFLKELQKELSMQKKR